MGAGLDIPPHFYGRPTETTARIVTWNVWGLHGPWLEREGAIVDTLTRVHHLPRVVERQSGRRSGGPAANARGDTWSNANPWATQLLWPDRRIDYVFTAAPRRGGAGRPRGAALVGTTPVDGVYPSDHFGVQADVRY